MCTILQCTTTGLVYTNTCLGTAKPDNGRRRNCHSVQKATSPASHLCASFDLLTLTGVLEAALSNLPVPFALHLDTTFTVNGIVVRGTSKNDCVE